MAEKVDVMEKILKRNPAHYDLIKKFIDIVLEENDDMSIDNIIILDGEMSLEEQEMVLIESYMNSGLHYDDALELAKARVFILNEIFQKGKSAIN